MADASSESIQRLIENSEKGLSQIEMSLPLILKTRKAIEEAIRNQNDRNVVLDLMLAVFDTLLAENEVIYDLSASLDALLRATNDYTKRYYMQSLNLCFWESFQLLAGEDGDEDGLLVRLEKLTKEVNQAGCQFLIGHIIDDIRAFRKEFADKDLRNITRHYDEPIKMYEKQQSLTDIDFFARGASQLMAIRMEVSVVTAYLLNLLATNRETTQNTQKTPSSKKCFDLKGVFNDAIFKALKEKNLKTVVQQALDEGQKRLEECYSLYMNCGKANEFLIERGCQTPDGFKKMEALLKFRMETLFMKSDLACSVWGYMNAASDKERSQNLRQIYITKQAALTHLYGYNENAREKSLWAKIVAMEEANSEKLDTEGVEKSLIELTSNLAGDRVNSNMYAHYRYKKDIYIPARLDAFGKMVHYKELTDTLKLLNVCKSLENYTVGLLYCIDETHKKESKKQYDEWMGIINNLVAKTGNDERAKEMLRPFRELIEMAYGDDEKSKTN